MPSIDYTCRQVYDVFLTVSSPSSVTGSDGFSFMIEVHLAHVRTPVTTSNRVQTPDPVLR